MSKNNWTMNATVSVLLSCIMVGSKTSAALTAYEPFNYTNVGGDLNGQSGGGSLGFTDAWSGNTSYNIGNGSLPSPVLPFPTSGNDMTTVAFGGNRDIVRTLTTPLGADNTPAYVSFLMRPEGILHQGAFDGWFSVSLRGSHQTNVVMGSNDFYYLEVSGTSSATTTTAVVGQTNLFVLRFDFTEGVDPVRLYINPQPGAPEPAVANVSQINLDVDAINLIDLTGSGANSIDEIRIGTTYADVTPLPEPSTVNTAIVAMSLSLCGLRRTRKSN
jgi:hypothetical protein